mgnify:CR=1 FL=1
MAYFAKIVDGIVEDVIVTESSFINTLEGTWIETSKVGSFRKQYAGIGNLYSSVGDVFYNSKPANSWTLDSDYDWQPPISCPDDASVDKSYNWDEDLYQSDNTKGWVEIE